MNKNLLIILLLPKIKSLSLSVRAKMKPIISHYYSHIYNIHVYRSAESTRSTWSRSSVFSECPCFRDLLFHRFVNLYQCQTVSTFFFFLKDILQF